MCHPVLCTNKNCLYLNFKFDYITTIIYPYNIFPQEIEIKKAIVKFANRNGNFEFFQLEKFMEFQSTQNIRFTQVYFSINTFLQ